MADLVKTDEELEKIEEEILDTPVEPEEAELESNFELEIVDPSLYGQEKSPALIEAEAKLAALEAQTLTKEATAGRDEATAANMAAIRAMQEQLSKGITVNQPPAEAPLTLFDQKAHRDKYNKNLYNDPAKETEEFIAPYMMELNKKIDSVNTRADRNSSKASMLENDDSRIFYSKYKEDIDKAMLNLPAGPEVYQKALSQVQSLHMDEIVAEKVAVELAKLQETPTPKPPITNVGKQNAPAIKGKTQITSGMNRWIKYQQNKGIGDTEWLVTRAKQLKADGAIAD